MAIATSCPHCEKSFKLADHLAGKRIRCPKCQQVFAVVPIVQPEPLPALPTAVSAIPLAPPAPEMNQAAAREGHHDDLDLEVPRPRRRRLKRRRSLLLAGILFIGGGLSLGTLLAFVVGVVLWALSKTEDPPAIVNTAAGKAVAGKVRDDAQHYALELPRHWQVMPAAEIQQFNAETLRRMPGANVHYSTGFRPKGGGLGGNSPYILLQVQYLKTKGMTHDDMEREMSKANKGVAKGMKQVQGAFSDVIKNSSIGSVTFDRSRNRVVMRLQIDGVGGEKAQIISIGHVGSDVFVFLHCYADDRQFAQHLTVFEQINDSFQFDSGFEFRPSSRWNFLWTVLISSLSGAMLGGLVGGTALFVYSRWRR